MYFGQFTFLKSRESISYVIFKTNNLNNIPLSPNLENLHMCKAKEIV